MPRSLVPLLLLTVGCRDSDLEPAYAEFSARVGFDLAEDLGAYLGAAEGSWSADGALPPGVELSADGWLEGIPEASGSWSFDALLGSEDGPDGLVAVDLHIPAVVLMSGYGPFQGVEENPSIEALWPLQEALVAGLDVRVVELPVVWDEAWELLLVDIEAQHADIVIATGVAGTDRMRFEINAVNVEEGTDNDGVTRSGEEVVDGGPDALADRLPEDAMSAAMEQAGYNASISDDAGTYLCNHVFYHLMHYAEHEAERDDLVAGFIHVSPADQYDQYSIEDITAAHTVGLEALSAWYDAGAVLRASTAADLHEAPVYHLAEGRR
jgi:pyroglutamyl-peptidase